MSLAHWTIAFQTGLLTGVLAVLLTFTPAAKLFEHRYGNALVVGVLTTLGDAFSRASHYRIPFAEHVATGAISGLLTLAASYLIRRPCATPSGGMGAGFRIAYPLTF